LAQKCKNRSKNARVIVKNKLVQFLWRTVYEQITWLVVTEVQSESFRLVTERRH